MGSNRRTSRAQYLSAVLCLVLTFSSSEAMVLCIGQDGHVAIEVSDSRCCGHLPRASCIEDAHTLVAVRGDAVRRCLQNAPSASSGQALTGILQTVLADDDCGACLDIPISSGLAEAVQAPDFVGWALAHRIEVVGQSPTLHHSLLDDSGSLVSNLDLKLPIVPSFFPPLRSVILLL